MKDIANSRLALTGIIAVSTLAMALVTVILLKSANFASCLLILSVVGLAATHSAFRQIEIDIVMIMALALPALFARAVSMWIFMIPGVLTGVMLAVVIIERLVRRQGNHGQQKSRAYR